MNFRFSRQSSARKMADLAFKPSSHTRIYCITCFAVLIATTSCVSSRDDEQSSAESTNLSDSSLMSQRQQAPIPNVDAIRRDEFGAILYVKGSNLSRDVESDNAYTKLSQAGSLGRQATYFLNFHRNEFRLSDPMSSFVVQEAKQDDLGYSQVRLSQQIDSLDVRNSQLIVQFGPDKHIRMVQGRYLVGPVGYALQPTFDANQAEQVVTSEFGAKVNRVYQGVVVLLQASANSNLVHEFFVTKSATDKVVVSVDAHSNQIVSSTPVVVTKY